jgi:Holliday junction DNA helicase RuvA
VPVVRVDDPREEAEQALVALGYKPAEAAKWVSSVEADASAGSAELIRLALRASAPGGA